MMPDKEKTAEPAPPDYSRLWKIGDMEKAAEERECLK